MNIDSLRKTIALAVPLSASQLITFLFSFVDAATFGRYGVNAVSGAAIALSFIVTVQLLGTGTVTAVGIRIARLLPNNDAESIRATFGAGVIISFLYFIISSIIIVIFIRYSFFTNIDTESLSIASSYLMSAMFGIPFSLLFIVFRGLLIGLGNTSITLFVAIGSLAIKVVANFLIVQNISDPSSAALFIGLSAVCCSLFTAVCLFIGVMRSNAARLFVSFATMRNKALLENTKLVILEGYPIGLSYAFEAGIYAVVAWILGIVGPVALAAHYVVKQYVHFTFMLLTGLAHVASIRISDAIGRNAKEQAYRISIECIAIAGFVVCVISIFYVIFPAQLIGLILDGSDPFASQVRAISSYVFVAAVFMQLFDSLQNVLSGILRGYNSAQGTMVAIALGYWVVGLPTIYLLSIAFKQGVVGAWIGLTIGLLTTCILMTVHFLRISSAISRSISPNLEHPVEERA